MSAFVTGLALASCGFVLAQPKCEPPAGLKPALAVDPSAGLRNALGGVYAEQGLTECAIEAFRNAIELDAMYWEPRLNLGLALAKLGQLREAAEHLEAAVRLNPSSLEAHLAWAFVLLEGGDPAAAEDPIQAALRLQPQSAQALFGMARVRMQQERFSAALSYLEQARETDPNSLDIPMMMGAAYARDGRYEEAIAVLAALVESHPDSASAHFNLATAYARTGNFPAAARHYGRVLELDPDNDVARMSGAKALAHYYKHEEVLQLVERYGARRPPEVDEFELHHLCGVALRGVGRYTDAEQDLVRVAALRPNHADTRYNLGFVLVRQQKHDLARVHLEKAKELDLASADTRFQLGRVLRALREETEAACVPGPETEGVDRQRS